MGGTSPKLLGEMRVRAGAWQVEYVIFRPTMIATDADILAVRDWNGVRRLLLGYRHPELVARTRRWLVGGSWVG